MISQQEIEGASLGSDRQAGTLKPSSKPGHFGHILHLKSQLPHLQSVDGKARAERTKENL